MLVFEQTLAVDAIIVAAAPEYHATIQRWCAQHGISKLSHIVTGGTERQDSILNALQSDAASRSATILVHDAVRPFITPAFVTSIVEAAQQHGAVAPGLPPKETVKEISEMDTVLHTHNRTALRLIQTPQGFERELLLQAYQMAQSQGFLGTDDASVVEFAGGAVRVVAGLEENIKITTPMDWEFAETLLRREASRRV